MTQLKALGGLWLESIPFTRPTPLLLLAYLSLEGSQQRRHLAELFWTEGNRMKSLSMTLTRLRQGAGEVVEADDKHARALLKSDAQELLEALDKSDWQRANELYTGAFLEGVVIEDWSSELEEWVYTTREYLAERVQYALLNLAEEAAKLQDFDKARELSERTYKLPGLSGTDLINLQRLYPLLCAGRSLLAPEVRKELEDFGFSVTLTTEEARATFKPTITPTTTLPLRSTTFVGRDEELTELATLLSKASVSLLTLLGPAGVGKTRLALQLAHEQSKLGAFKDGIYFVALDALNDAALIAPTLLSLLGLTQQGNTEPLHQLTNFITDKNLLLVLDNFEHLTEGSSLLSELLSHCPNLKLLMTSRERLKLEEEHLYTLEGLAYPVTVSEDASLSEAIQLFRERAQQVKPDFDVEQNLADVIRICGLVEGLPLGIELAASWVRLLSCHDIAFEIERGLELLATDTKNVPERHRSLKAAFEQSWSLLTDKEQEVLRKLSVFVGGFRREAASEVAGATIPVLASLVDKSLLKVLPNGRYDRHPLLYQFTQEKLSEQAKEEVVLKSKHANYFLAWANRAEEQLHLAYRKFWLEQFDEELNNLRTALAWSLSSNHPAVGLGIVTVLEEAYDTRGLYQEACVYLEKILSLPQARDDALLYARGLTVLANCSFIWGEVEKSERVLDQASRIAEELGSPFLKARILLIVARGYQYSQGDYNKAKEACHEAAKLARQVNHRILETRVFLRLSSLSLELEEYDEAFRLCEHMLSLWRELGNTSSSAYVLNQLGVIVDGQGHYEQARHYFEQSLGLFRELSEEDGVALAVGNLGGVSIVQKKYALAYEQLSECLSLRRKSGEQRAIAYTLGELGKLAFMQSHYDEAQRYYNEALAIFERQGYKMHELDVLRLLGQLYQARGQLEQARSSYQRSLDVSRDIGDQRIVTNALYLLATVCLEVKDYAKAKLLLEETLLLASERKSRRDILFALEGFAALHQGLEQFERAAYLQGFTSVFREDLGESRHVYEQQRHETALEELRQTLGKKYEALLREGQAMTLEQASGLILKLNLNPQPDTVKSA